MKHLLKARPWTVGALIGGTGFAVLAFALWLRWSANSVPQTIDELSTRDWPKWRWAVWRFGKDHATNLTLQTPGERRALAVETLRGNKVTIQSNLARILPLLLQEDTSGSARVVLSEVRLPAEALPILLQGSADNSPQVRRNCGSLLGDFCDQEPEAQAMLLRLLQDSEHSVKLAAVRALRELKGDPTAAALELISCLQDSNQNVRMESMVTLSTYGTRASNVIGAVEAILPQLDQAMIGMAENMVLEVLKGKSPATELPPPIKSSDFE